MRLNQQTDFALRILMTLAANHPKMLTVAQVYTHFDISKGHLTKVANLLVKRGFLLSTRGRNGGMRLAKNPEEIHIGEVVRVCEYDFSLVECMHDGDACRISPVCQLPSLVEEAKENFLSTLNKYSLADLQLPKNVNKKYLVIDAHAIAI